MAAKTQLGPQAKPSVRCQQTVTARPCHSASTPSQEAGGGHTHLDHCPCSPRLPKQMTTSSGAYKTTPVNYLTVLEVRRCHGAASLLEAVMVSFMGQFDGAKREAHVAGKT